jgi:hypothetical protein
MSNKLNLSQNVRLVAGRIICNGNAESEGTLIWKFESNSNPEILKSISARGNDIIINLAGISKIQTFCVWPNEHLASMGIFVGEDASRSIVQIPISAFQKTGLQGGYVRGDGTNFVVSGDIVNWAVTKTINTFQFTPVNSYAPGDATLGNASGNYVGSTPNRALEKLLSGLSQSFAHRLINNTTMAAVSATTSDVIDFIVNAPNHRQLNLNQNDAMGWPGANILTASAIINIIAIVEI